MVIIVTRQSTLTTRHGPQSSDLATLRGWARTRPLTAAEPARNAARDRRLVQKALPASGICTRRTDTVPRGAGAATRWLTCERGIARLVQRILGQRMNDLQEM